MPAYDNDAIRQFEDLSTKIDPNIIDNPDFIEAHNLYLELQEVRKQLNSAEKTFPEPAKKNYNNYSI